MKKVKPRTCYFTPEEDRELAKIADREERPATRIVQFALRAFCNMYKEDRGRALQLAQTVPND
jgi:hypothetical protein